MATIERELTHENSLQLSLRLNREQQSALREAASAAGQSLEDFATTTLLNAADAALIAQTGHPLDKIIGIFEHEPLMDALMERIREDRHVEIKASTAD